MCLYKCENFASFAEEKSSNKTINSPYNDILHVNAATGTVLDVLHPFQIIDLFDFFDSKFDQSSYLKICAKYHFFYCRLLYKYKIFKNDLNLVMFVQIF